MPEGDTIFRAARALDRALAGEVVAKFETAYATLARVHDQSPITGRTIERVESRGKWLLIYFSGDLVLVTHMLMSGSWRLYRVGEPWRRGRSHMRVVLETPSVQAVAFDVPVARFHTARTLRRDAALSALGPDLLGPSFSSDDAAQRLLAHPKDEIGEVLLNQRVLAGIGNVFKSEICFVCGIDPFRRVADLLPREVDCLIAAARKLLAANVVDRAGSGSSAGGRSTTGSSERAARLWVYRRQGQECRRCGAAILMRKQGSGARSTYWCPQCQSSRSSA